ncbi:helix-turn-helix domain-containing protein [Gordonia neofelifaecis]|uniref:Helix-turn-helix, AraC domain protein n=1 Tax=Gordonia neofelifaecis NRRL B-59395 TaxID=644548 RepID=F1YMA1_9ACTN|nr:helix-turn-helix domain-containing protein [Gordonia neofelifaecis]EGD54150.1 Helix-turn-helix, AraC domain protein [Gordonia neofelifaecis NRRL B-59395]
MTGRPPDPPQPDPPPPDHLRRLLDAVLDEANDDLGAMAGGAFTSQFHFARQVRRGSGEPPIALRRRVLLERAAWQMQRGASVTDTAFASGYSSVEGFSRAFARAYGHPPTALPPAERVGHWLPAPNGIHFHSPTALYVDSTADADGAAAPSGDVVALLTRHDIADIGVLIEAVASLGPSEYRRRRLPGSAPRAWDGPDESISQVMWHLVVSREPWLSTIAGDTMPDLTPVEDVAVLRDRHADVSARWLATIRDIERRDAWSDRVIDALCEPPESFLLGQIVAHELTFSAHRRLLVRWMLRDAGVDVDVPALDPDPIIWHRRHTGGGVP